jgi:hypothetical protein
VVLDAKTQETLERLVEAADYLRAGVEWYREDEDDTELDRVVYAGVTHVETLRDELMEELERGALICDHWHDILNGEVDPRALEKYLREKTEVGRDAERMSKGGVPSAAIRWLSAALPTGSKRYGFTMVANALGELARICGEGGILPGANGIGEALATCALELH